MSIEQFVPTPETSAKLKDAGYPKRTYFTWWHGIKVEEWWLDPFKELPKDSEIITAPAPSLQELLNELHNYFFAIDDTPTSVNKETSALLSRIILAQNPAEEAAQVWLEKHGS
ncbi:MAG: hypothetical protein MUF71_01080 [Candidatus Kapabacteria bacterium]|jgi:hypothetical protein|nr:hypothetical protein [Candidatus Kapabacteria bacterium]